MDCLRCGAQLSSLDYCPNCGEDMGLFKKIMHISNAYYNEGLEKATVRDLSGAIQSLQKSLKYNKKNIGARNLLGLIYFEMGDTVSALGEWVISKNFQSNKNIAGNYLSEIQKNEARLASINQTIKKYNQALLYCKHDSEDLAVIQLKKVLSLNPKLIVAHQLLALLYMQGRDYAQAKKWLKKAAEIDRNNTTTLRYLKEVGEYVSEGSTGVKKVDVVKEVPINRITKKENMISYQNGNETIIQPTTSFKEHTGVAAVVNILIGLIIGGLIVYFLVIPGIKQSSKSDANKSLIEANDTISAKNVTISNMEKEVENAMKTIDDARAEVDASKNTIMSYQQLFQAYSAYIAEDLAGAGVALQGVSKDLLEESYKEVYDVILIKVNEVQLSTLYSEGDAAYNAGNFEESILKWEQIILIDENYEEGNLLYFLGQSYRKAEQWEKAIVTYEKVIELYPGTNRARNSSQYIEEIKRDHPVEPITEPENGETPTE